MSLQKFRLTSLFAIFDSFVLKRDFSLFSSSLLRGEKSVPPLRSDFPDFGPIPVFFDDSGPEMVRICGKSPDFRKNCLYTSVNVVHYDQFKDILQ